MSSEGKTCIDRKIQDSDEKVHNEEISLEAICKRLKLVEPPTTSTGFALLGVLRLSLSGLEVTVDGPPRLSRPGGLLKPLVHHRSGLLSLKCQELDPCTLSAVILLYLIPLFRPVFIWSLVLCWYLYGIIIRGCRFLGRVFTLLLYLRYRFSFHSLLVRRRYRRDVGGLFLHWRVQDNIRRLICGGLAGEI